MSSGPRRAERPRERLRRSVTGTGESEDFASLMHCDLADDVGGGTEPVEPNPRTVAREPERSVADQPGAEERRSLKIGEAVGDGEAESLVGDAELGIASVEVVPREPCPVAEVLPAREAVRTLAAGPAEPGDPYAVPGSEAARARDDLADDLVPEHEWERRARELAVEHV